MNKKNIVNFSNIYSPRNQNLLSKHQFTNNSKQTGTPKSLSPRMKQSVSNIPYIEKFRQVSKLRLNQGNIKKIQQKLQYQHDAQHKLDERVRLNQLFVQYNYNPFTDEFGFQGEIPKMQGQKRNIIDQILNMIQGNNLQNVKKRLTPSKYQVLKAQKLLSTQTKKHQIKRHKIDEKQFKNTHKNQADGSFKVKNQLDELDELVNMKEQSYFLKQNKTMKMNIFSMIKEKDSQLIANTQILKKYYFNFTSMMVTSRKNKKLQLNFLKTFSVFSRQLIKNKIDKKMPFQILVHADDLRLDLFRLKYENFMQIAEGRLHSKALLIYFNQDIQKADKYADQELSQIKEQKKIIDEPQQANKTNKLINCDQANQQKADITYYNRVQFTNLEKKQQKLSLNFKKKLQQVLEKQITSIGNSIKDKHLMSVFNKEKQNILLSHLEGNIDKRLAELMKEVERKIRLNKISKNRNETTKINILIQSLKFKKKMQKNFHEERSKSRGKSLSKGAKTER